jgi:peroxiredoxin Q/BCP
MGKEYMGVARSTFLISPDKIIAHTWSIVKPKNHAEQVLTFIAGIVSNLN